jgi:hypothetical protein
MESRPGAGDVQGIRKKGSEKIFLEKLFSRVLLTLAQIESQYGDRAQLVFRNYPIDPLHPGAR